MYNHYRENKSKIILVIEVHVWYVHCIPLLDIHLFKGS